MKRSIVIACLFSIVFFGLSESALAAEASAGWRQTFDSVMRWINFFILAALVVKFGKTPLGNFISGQKEKMVRDLKRKEEEKERAVQEVNAIFEKVRASEGRLEELKERIVAQGRKKRQELIDDANSHSRYMITSVRDRLTNQILKARHRVKTEMLESAVELALSRLPDMITEEDNDNMLRQFLSGTERR